MAVNRIIRFICHFVAIIDYPHCQIAFCKLHNLVLLIVSFKMWQEYLFLQLSNCHITPFILYHELKKKKHKYDVYMRCALLQYIFIYNSLTRLFYMVIEFNSVCVVLSLRLHICRFALFAFTQLNVYFINSLLCPFSPCFCRCERDYRKQQQKIIKMFKC